MLSVFGTGGFRHFGNACALVHLVEHMKAIVALLGPGKGPVHAPADLKGLKVRVTKSPVDFILFKAWGGIPVPYDWSNGDSKWLQTYQGLQTGVVEGLYVPIPYQYLFKMHEIAKFYTETGGIWWGGIPVPYDWMQTYQGLQTGVVRCPSLDGLGAIQ